MTDKKISYADNVRRIPFGFRNLSEFREFGKTLHSGFREAGFDDVTAIMQGSATTGKSFAKEKIFNGDSDFDVAIVSPSLFNLAKNMGLKVWGKTNQPRILLEAEESRVEIEGLGLTNVTEELRKKAGRVVNFMVYRSKSDAFRRAEYSADRMGVGRESANIPIPKQ
ncbi:hypothetical protein QUF72_07030 [Desulfobacterales bacterium HSG2]|nr:hypothetical protein [Desulfobacterales bacterium HSG2]